MNKNKLIKQVELGAYKFDVAVNKAILAQTLDGVPKFSEFMKGDKVSKGTQSWESVFGLQELVPDIVKFAFPLMLKEAGFDIESDKIIDYVYENEVDDVFNEKMFDFIMSAFTGGKLDRTPKVKFAMK